MSKKQKLELTSIGKENASDHAIQNGGTPWKYLLIPHDAIAENMSIQGLTAQFCG